MYATAPVIALGRTLLQDLYSSTPLAATVVPQSSLAETSYSYQAALDDDTLSILLQAPTKDEIARYFSAIHPLKYSQPHQPLPSPFSAPLNDLTITAYNAGHTLGGTIWHIQYGMESIVHAVDWNLIRENVFAGAAWFGGSGAGGTEVIEQLRKPTALICGARGADRNNLTKKRDDTLLATIRSSIARNGVVLIPSDSSARVIELAYALDHAWRRDPADQGDGNSLREAKLYLASRTAGATMRHVRSMLEWMDDNVVKEFESEATNNNAKQHRRNDSRNATNGAHINRDSQAPARSNSPFEFQFLKMVETRKKIEKILSSQGPRIIIASDSSLEWGFAKDVLARIASNSSNLLILTDGYSMAGANESPQSLAGVLRQWYDEAADGAEQESTADVLNPGIRNIHHKEVKIVDSRRIALEGKELLVYQQYLATRRQEQGLSEQNRSQELEATADAVDDASSSSSSSDESDPERQGKALNVSVKTAKFTRGKTEPDKETLGVNVLIRQPGIYDYDVRGKKGRDQMFPFVNRRRRADDFGELIKPEDYLRAEERDDVNGHDLRENSPGNRETVGQKRKWQDSRIQDERKSNGRGPSKRQQLDKPPLGEGDTKVNGIHHHPHESSPESSEEETDYAAAVPSKLESTSEMIEVNLRVAHVDFSGLHDQRSLTVLIPLIQPKKIILVSGSVSETAVLAHDCNQKLASAIHGSTGKAPAIVFMPAVGQTVDASVDTNAWTVKLSEALLKRFHWQKVRALSIATLMGLLSAAKEIGDSEDLASRKKVKMGTESEDEIKPSNLSSETDNKSALVPILDVLPANMAAATRSVTQPLHVGDLRLADLRKVLQSSGYTAEFRGEGTLLIDGLVAVRKSANGRIEVESVGRDYAGVKPQHLEGSFYTVKRKIYECLAVVAGA